MALRNEEPEPAIHDPEPPEVHDPDAPDLPEVHDAESVDEDL
jgi:hypothetical protein